jgi:serine/threonine protein kinase
VIGKTGTAAAEDSRAPGPPDAQLSTQDPLNSLTHSGQVLGSPSYAPPEQAAGRRSEIGPPSDVYALGAILYHLLTGRPPFAAASLASTITQVLHAEPVSPRLLNPSVPRDLETICLKCLEKEPRRRYATAHEFADELGRFLADKPIVARPVGLVGRVWRWSRRQPVLAGVSVAFALSVIVGVAGILWQLHRARDPAWRTNSDWRLQPRRTANRSWWLRRNGAPLGHHNRAARG